MERVIHITHFNSLINILFIDLIVIFDNNFVFNVKHKIQKIFMEKRKKTQHTVQDYYLFIYLFFIVYCVYYFISIVKFVKL